MAELGPGLYESLITEGLKAELDELAGRLMSEQRALRSAEAADRRSAARRRVGPAVR